MPFRYIILFCYACVGARKLKRFCFCVLYLPSHNILYTVWMAFGQVTSGHINSTKEMELFA